MSFHQLQSEKYILSFLSSDQDNDSCPYIRLACSLACVKNPSNKLSIVEDVVVMFPELELYKFSLFDIKFAKTESVVFHLKIYTKLFLLL